MRKTILSFKLLILVTLSVSLYGQTFNLKQCVDYAIEHSSQIKISEYEKEVASKKVIETIGSGLPQVDGSASYANNIKLSTIMMPGDFFGQPGTLVPLQMGSKLNSTASVVVRQSIINPMFWVGLGAAKISNNYSKQNLRNTTEKTIYNIGKIYIQAIIVKKQLNTLISTEKLSANLLASTDLRYKNGLARKIDVDRIKVSHNNLMTAVQQTELGYKQIINNLKYLIGMSQEKELDIVEIENFPEFDTYEVIKGKENFFEDRVDYRLLKIGLDLQKAERNLYIAQYIPSLSLTYNYGYQAQTNFFDDLKDSKNWFASSSIGLSLSVPIFSGFQRWFRISQANTNIRKIEESIATSVEAMKVEVNNYGSQYINAFENMKNEKESLNLAEEVYKSVQLDYEQGRASALDIIQAETSYTESQNNYYDKLLSLYLARLDIEQSKGNVINFINNLK